MKMKTGLKREREKQNGFKSKEERTEQMQADHELFLQAFESKFHFLPAEGASILHIFLLLYMVQKFCLFSSFS